MVRVVQDPSYRKMTIRLKDAAVCGDRVTPNMATYAFLICHNGCKMSYVYQIALGPRDP